MKCRNLASRAAAVVAALGLFTAAGAAPSTNVFIGAPNSSPDWDNIADAVADTDSGGTVNVQAGVYNPSGTVVISQPITILGPQADVDPRSLVNAGFRTPGSVAEARIAQPAATHMFSIQSNDVTINGLEFFYDGGTASNFVTNTGVRTNITFEYNIMNGPSTAVESGPNTGAVDFQDVSGLNVRYNRIFNFRGDGTAGIDIWTSTNVNVMHNEVYNIHGVGSPGQAVYLVDSQDITIQHNYITDNGSPGRIRKGAIYVLDSSGIGATNANISYNLISGAPQSAIRLQVDGSVGNPVIVSGNELINGHSSVGSSNAGLYVTARGSHVHFLGNRVHGNQFNDNLKAAVYYLSSAAVASATNKVMRYNEIFNNTNTQATSHGLHYRNNFVSAPAVLDAQLNWWGDAAGPQVWITNLDPVIAPPRDRIRVGTGTPVDFTNHLASPIAVAAVDQGANPDILSHDYGFVTPGMTDDEVFTIRNSSADRPLVINHPGFSFTGDPVFTVVHPTNGVTLFPMVIPPGESRDLTIRFSPVAAVAYSGTASTIGADGGTEVYNLPLTGTGLVPSPPAELDAITVADADGANGAQPGFTNDATVTVTFGTFGGTVSDIEIAEDMAFSANLASFTYSMQASEPYTLSGGDGDYNVWARAIGPGGNSTPTSTTITLDTGAPGQLGGGELTLEAGAQTDITSISADFTVTFDEAINTLNGMATTSGLTEDAISLASSTVDTTGITIGISSMRADDGPFTITLSGTAPATGDLIVEFVPGSIVDPAGNPLDVTGISATLTLTTDVSDWLLLD